MSGLLVCRVSSWLVDVGVIGYHSVLLGSSLVCSHFLIGNGRLVVGGHLVGLSRVGNGHCWPSLLLILSRGHVVLLLSGLDILLLLLSGIGLLLGSILLLCSILLLLRRSPLVVVLLGLILIVLGLLLLTWRILLLIWVLLLLLCR